MIDLEKARATDSAGCAEDAANLVPDLIAGIERLRADNAGLSKAVISIQEERDLAQAEFRAYHKAWEEQAIEIERLRGEMENYGDDYVCQMKSKDARIQELEDALAEERAHQYSLENAGTLLSQAGDKFQKRCRRSARNQLQAEGKIGPDTEPANIQALQRVMRKQHDHPAEMVELNADHQYQPEAPRSWQITDERIEFLRAINDILEDAGFVSEDVMQTIRTVLRDMLAEATR